MTAVSSTLYSVVLEGPGGDAADALRYYHAQEALSDPQWREIYDRVADGPLGFPENLPRVARRMRTIRPGGATDEQHHLLGMQWTDVDQCVEQLARRAEQLGVLSTAMPLSTDRAAAAIGAHLWCAAVGVCDIARAAALGHDAVSALSAVLARALGEGAVFTTTTPSGATHPVYQLEELDPVIDMCYSKAQALTNDDVGREVLRLVAHDLSYRAIGGSVTYQAALRVRDYLSTIPPNKVQTETGVLGL